MQDIGEFGIAPKVLRATQDYNDQNNKRRKLLPFNEGPIPGTPVLANIFEPVRETIGSRILKKMGWKPGQGVGPRVSKAEKIDSRKKEKAKGSKIYGCAAAPPSSRKTIEDDDDEDDEDLDENITFAPEDVATFLCKPKDNVFGIGYVGLNKDPILGHINLFETSHLKLQEKNKKVNIRGQVN